MPLPELIGAVEGQALPVHLDSLAEAIDQDGQGGNRQQVHRHQGPGPVTDIPVYLAAKFHRILHFRNQILSEFLFTFRFDGSRLR